MEFPNDKLLNNISQTEELVSRLNWLIANHEASSNLLLARLHALMYLRDLTEQLVNIVTGEVE